MKIKEIINKKNQVKVIPNCAACAWNKTLFLDNYCSAQGEKYLNKAYNTEECKMLYKLKEVVE